LRLPRGSCKSPRVVAIPPEVAQSESQSSSLETRLGHRFESPSLLAEALTHPSYANQQGQRRAALSDNQRLEFLGDAIVDLCVSERLFDADREAREGLLTERRAGLVNEQRLALAAKDFGLGEHLLLGSGEERAGFRERASVLADAFEAVTAAIFLDGGQDAARAFVLRALPELIEGRPQRLKPAKALLQELAQERWKLTPSYAIVPVDALEPASPGAGADASQLLIVTAEVRIGTRLSARGEGSSRKEAETQAAAAALAQIGRGVCPTPAFAGPALQASPAFAGPPAHGKHQ